MGNVCVKSNTNLVLAKKELVPIHKSSKDIAIEGNMDFYDDQEDHANDDDQLDHEKDGGQCQQRSEQPDTPSNQSSTQANDESQDRQSRTDQAEKTEDHKPVEVEALAEAEDNLALPKNTEAKEAEAAEVEENLALPKNIEIEIEPSFSARGHNTSSDDDDDDSSEDDDVQPLTALLDIPNKDEINEITSKAAGGRPMSQDMAEIRRQSKLMIRPTSTAARLSKDIKLEMKEEVGDLDSNVGNLLMELEEEEERKSKDQSINSDDVQNIDDVNGELQKEEDKKIFGLENGKTVLENLTKSFQVAKTRESNRASIDDYAFNGTLSQQLKQTELDQVTPEMYRQALFHMYGACEGVNDDNTIVHNLLRKHEVWDGSPEEASKHLQKQIVVMNGDDSNEGDDLSEVESIVRFLNKHSKLGKTVKEIEEIGQTLSFNLYKIVDSENAITIKVPRQEQVTDKDDHAFLDLIYQTQLVQFLNDKKTEDGQRQFFPSVHEEIFVVNQASRTLLNYVTIVDNSAVSLIDMLDGPTAGGFKNEEEMDEEGYRSQEIFTQEKYCYLFWKGVRLLEFLFDRGITHGNINANSLGLTDKFTFTLSDCHTAILTPKLAELSRTDLAQATVVPRGFYKKTTSGRLVEQLQAQDPIFVRELIQEDWKDLASAFYFPRMAKQLTDDKIREFVEITCKELLTAEACQEPGQIKLLATKANRFMADNHTIFTNLIENLRDEQMMDAVDSIAVEIHTMGTEMDNPRLQALALLTLGEILSQEHLNNEDKAEEGIDKLQAAYELYQQDPQIMNGGEYSRMCLGLSTLYRSYKKDTAQAKRWLELAKDSITDKKVLLQFYTESANILTGENKLYQALDSNKKAMEIAKQLYREDDYTMFELQISLAENYEKCGEKEQAQAVFDECFQQMDGRDGDSVYSRGMSVRSKLSRAISIKSKGTSLVMYGKQRMSGQSIDFSAVQVRREKAGAMQRIAVQLRQKQEYGRAEKLMLKAIQTKKQITNSEVSEDIAYLYSELAVTYHGNDDLEGAAKCTKKQLAIWDQLGKSETMEYVQCLFFLGEILRDLEQPVESIPVLERAIRKHETAVQEGDEVSSEGQLALERTGFMKMLAEEYMKNRQRPEGIKVAQEALELQKKYLSEGNTQLLHETMLLLAEVFTVSKDAQKALQMYQQILSSSQNQTMDKDIYRKMAPLHTKQENYVEAATCLKKVIESEDKEILKVGLLTKIAGNYKKADAAEECIQASQDAYDLIKVLSGPTDQQTCRVLINLAAVKRHFEKDEEAKLHYKEFVAMFDGMDGQEGRPDWTQVEAYVQLKDLATEAINEIEGTGEGEGEEYYDEEAAPEDGENQEEQ